jgi:hypothetical protein
MSSLAYIIVFIVILVIAIITIITGKKKPKYSPVGASNSHDIVEILLRKAAENSIEANKTNDPYTSLIYASYGTAYLSALHDISNDRKIFQDTGVEVEPLRREVAMSQDLALKKLRGY